MLAPTCASMDTHSGKHTACSVQEHQKLHGKELYFSSAQLTQQHAKEEIAEQSLLVVANFPRKQIGPHMSDCLITGVQVDSEDAAQKTASTVFVTFSHPVKPGQGVTVTGSDEVMKENTRQLTWDAFTRADVRVGGVIDATCQQQSNEGSLQEWNVSLDFGQKLGVMQGKVMLNSSVFASREDMLSKQVLAVTNLIPQGATDDSLVEAAVLTVAGRALLQPAKEVANGCKLA